MKDQKISSVMSGLGTLHSLAVDEFPCMKNLQRGAKGPKTLPSRSPRALKESEPGHDLQVCKGWRDSTAEVFCKASPHRRHPCPCRAPLARGDLSWGLWVPLPWSLPDTGGTLGSFSGGDARVLHRLFPWHQIPAWFVLLWREHLLCVTTVSLL